MTNERKEELVRKIVAYAAEQGNTLIDTPREVLQAVTDDIVENIGGLPSVLMPFYITALENMAQTLRANFQDEAEIADDLKSKLTCYCVGVRNRRKRQKQNLFSQSDIR